VKRLPSHARSVVKLLGFALLTLSTACVVGEESDNIDEEDTDTLDEPLAGMLGVYQAENNTFQSGCTKTTVNGTGFMDYGGKDSLVEWNNVNVASPGPYTVTFRYANGSSGALPSHVVVNDDLANPTPVQFGSTGAWTTWGNTTAITVNLKAGNNKLRVTATTSSGGPHLDKMEVRSRSQCAEANEGTTPTLSCPAGQAITSIDFASFGTPTGTCGGGFSKGTCDASTSLSNVKAACVGKNSCSVVAGNGVFGDPCAGVAKQLKVKYTCGDSPSVSVEPWAQCLQLYPSVSVQPPPGGVVRDKWGRNIDSRGLLMVDWEGAMGNPEVQIQISAPQGMKLPVKMFVSVPNAPLVYLDAWSGVQDAQGPHTTKAIEFFTPDEVKTFKVGINPDRDFNSETYALHVDFTGSDGAKKLVDVPLRVCDQDRLRPADFKFTRKVLDTYGDGWLNGQGVMWDNNKDGVHDGVQARKLMAQIIDDIEYYLAPLDVDTVPVGQTTTQVSWDPAAAVPPTFHNTEAFNGFYLITSLGLGSTGLPGKDLNTRDGKLTDLPSNGVILIDRQLPPEWKSTNHVDGWFFHDGVSKDWWRSSRWQEGPSPTGNCPAGQSTCSFYPTNFYSVIKHELLHTLAFESGWPKWKHFKDVGCIDDPVVMAHTGKCTPVYDVHAWDPQLHKRASDQGVELIDDFEMLVLQAVGWKLRDTTPLVKLQIANTAWPKGNVGSPYGFSIPVRGGVPAYRFLVTGGSLPPGVALDSFTGKLSGTPTKAGTYNLTVQVADSGISVPVLKSVGFVVN